MCCCLSFSVLLAKARAIQRRPVTVFACLNWLKYIHYLVSQAEVQKLLFDDSFQPFRTLLKRNGTAAPFRGCRGHSIAPLALPAFPLQIYTVGDHLRIKKTLNSNSKPLSSPYGCHNCAIVGTVLNNTSGATVAFI